MNMKKYTLLLALLLVGVLTGYSHPDGFLTHPVSGEIDKQVGRLLAVSCQHSY